MKIKQACVKNKQFFSIFTKHTFKLKNRNQYKAIFNIIFKLTRTDIRKLIVNACLLHKQFSVKQKALYTFTDYIFS